MSAVTGIEWTDRTWNPVRGCSVISPGCINCYAMKTAHRFSGAGGPYEGLTKQTSAGPQWTGIVRPIESALLEPLSWRKPSKVFVNSMSDLFHEDVPDAFIDKVFAVMALAPQHTFQILTKRPDRMRAYLSDAGIEERIVGDALDCAPWPLRNVWLGVSVENQHFADERIPLLLQTPAAVRFISAEPLLGPVDLKPEWLGAVECCHVCGEPKYPVRQLAGVETRQGWPGCVNESCDAYGEQKASGSSRRMLDWVIVGGESGAGARPFHIDWARSIIAQCKAAGVPVFVKQFGANLRDRNDAGFEGDAPRSWPMDTAIEDIGLGDWQGDPVRVRLKDRKGGDPAEWPEDLRVREFPA